MLASLALLVGAAGCAHIDTTPAGDPDRVLRGTIRFDTTLPAGAEIVARLIEPPANDGAQAASSDLPVAAQSSLPRAERVLGEFRQVLETGRMQPLPFEIEYHAEDAVLRRGLNLDVRVSVGGKVTSRTIRAHAVTLGSAPFQQDVAVQAVR